MLSKEQSEKIAVEVITILYSSYEYLPNDYFQDNNPFLYEFLKPFGKNHTDLLPNSSIFDLSNKSFFENVAHILCNGEKKEFTKTRENLLKVTNQQKKPLQILLRT